MWRLSYLCLFALQVCATEVKDTVPNDAVATTEAETAMDQLVIETIETANQALNLYDKLVDRVIPWKEFNETLVQLDDLRKDYSVESAEVIGEIKTHMLDGIDAYFTASQNIYEWAGSAASHLTLYISLFNGYNIQQAAAQKKLLIEMLDSGVQKMTAAQADLGKSSLSFNSVFGRLMTLRTRFEHECDEKSGYYKKKIKKIRKRSYLIGAIFGLQGLIIAPIVAERKFVRKIKKKMKVMRRFYDDLKIKMEQAFYNIDEAKKTLKTEIQHISELKIQTEQTEMFVNLDGVSELRDTVIDSAQELIAKCTEYRKRHIKNNELI